MQQGKDATAADERCKGAIREDMTGHVWEFLIGFYMNGEWDKELVKSWDRFVHDGLMKDPVWLTELTQFDRWEMEGSDWGKMWMSDPGGANSRTDAFLGQVLKSNGIEYGRSKGLTPVFVPVEVRSVPLLADMRRPVLRRGLHWDGKHHGC